MLEGKRAARATEFISVRGALRKTARFVSGVFKGKGTKKLHIGFAPLEKL